MFDDPKDPKSSVANQNNSMGQNTSEPPAIPTRPVTPVAPPMSMQDSPLREQSERNAPPVEDIFSSTEPLPVGSTNTNSNSVPEELAEPRRLNMGLVVGIVAALLIFAGVAWAAWTYFLAPKPPTTPVVTTPPAPAPAPTPAVLPPPTQPTTITPVDSDNDRLSDAEEAQYGTNPYDPDTDHDGLTDYEEVKVYHTNPLNPDTDGDGFKDGDEVKGGFDPNKGGGAKLLDLQKALDNSNTNTGASNSNSN